ncbi:MAG: hypothetical protein HY744_07965 [Deltaproteobacteria bacterium]|nr:hypothetical protein [Deltaproteobacteria bacterium]
MIDEDTREAAVQEIAEKINAALGRHGVAGVAVVTGSMVELRGSGSPVAVDLGPMVEQWPLLPPDMRERKAEHAATRLVAALRGGDVPRAMRPGRARSWLGTLLAAVVLLGALGAAGYWLYRRNFFGEVVLAPTAPSAAESALPPAERERARAARVCDAVRSRIYSGANMGAFDTAGWEVELWLARLEPAPALVERADLRKLVAAGRLDPGADAVLGKVEHGSVELVAPQPAAGTKLGAAVAVLRFDGDYVLSFLSPDGRGAFLGFAERQAKAAGADLAALYGKCAHLRWHDLGGWYWGADRARAAAALLYAAGMFAEQPTIDMGKLAASSGLLPALVAAAGRLDAEALRRIAVEHAGAADGEQQTALRFHMGKPTGALFAARGLAQQLGLAPGAAPPAP